MIVDLTKKYKTVSDRKVVLYAKYGDIIHGAVYAFGRWQLTEWTENGRRTVGFYKSNYDLVEVWEPQEGELVYVWNTNTAYPNIRRFAQMNDRGTLYLCVDMQAKNGYLGYKYCAPFDGTLPKELQCI